MTGPNEQRVAAPVLAGTLDARALATILARALETRTVSHLIVSDGLSERCVFFPVGGLRLSSVGPRRGRTPLDVLLARRDTKGDQRRALEVLQAKVQAVVQAAVARHAQGTDSEPDEPDEELLTENEVEDTVDRLGLRQQWLEAVRGVVKDELLDLAAWDDARYEFRESNPPAKLFRPELEAVKVSLGVKDLLNEVRTASGEWTRMAPKLGVPSRTKIHCEHPERVHSVAGAAGAMLEALPRQGARLADLLLAARKKGHDVVAAGQALIALDERGVIRIDTVPPTAGAEERKQRALSDIDRIEAAIALMVQELQARRRLAQACKEVGDVPRAIQNLRVVEEALIAEGRDEEALEVLRDVLGMAPQAFDARERVARLLERVGRLPEAVAEWLGLARQLSGMNLFNRALKALRRAIGLEPGNLDHRRRLIAALEAHGDREQAVQELEQVAALYEEQGQPEAALACWDDLLRLAPDHPMARSRLEGALLRSSRFLPAVVGIPALALLFLVAGGWVWRRHQALEAWARSRETALAMARDARWGDARKEVRLVALEHGLEEGRLEPVLALIDHLEEEVAREKLLGVQALEREGKVLEARDRYAALEKEHSGRPSAASAAERMKAIAAQEEEAAKLALELEKLLAAGKAGEALPLARDLAARLAWTQAAARTVYPVEVRVTPAGAALAVDGESWPGRTPFTVARPLSRPSQLVVALNDHLPWSGVLDLRQPGFKTPLEVALPRAPRWRSETLGSLVAEPTLLDGGLVVGGEDPLVYSIDGDGQTRWRVALAPFAALVGRPVATGRSVVVAETGGRVRAVDRRSGSPMWTRELEEEVSAVGAAEGGLVILSAPERLLALDPETGDQVWTRDLNARLAAPARLVTPQRILAGTDDGRVSFVDASTGKLETRLAAGGRPSAPPTLGGTASCLVATEDGELKSVWRGVVWTRKLPAPAVHAPAVTEDAIYVSAGTHLLRLDPREGDVMWDLDLETTVGAPTATPGGRVYVGGADGVLRALTARNGELRWSLKLQGEVVAAPVIHRGTVFAVSTGQEVLAIVD